MKILDKITTYFKDKEAERRIAHYNHLQKELSEDIQIKEFQNRMYIAVDGTPIIDTAELKNDAIVTLKGIRQTITNYKCRTI